jgi:hypothetical protein
VTEGSGNHDATAAANQAASTTELRGGSTTAKIEFGVVAAIALVLAGHVFGGVPTADFADGIKPWCDLDLRFAASTEPTCSAVAGKMEAKVTASGAGLLACF